MEPALDVVLVEDDRVLREVLTFHLQRAGFRVRAFEDGVLALEACEQTRPQLVVLDVMLPGINGLEVCTTLRKTYHPSPGIVMLTARDAEIDVVLGLEVGADDYVVKPCRPNELIARLRALARRAIIPPGGQRRSELPEGPIEPVRIDAAGRRVWVQGSALRLTPSEFALLQVLSAAPERVFSRMELLSLVFDSTHPGYARNVDCHITRLRRKLETAGLDPPPVHTRHGAGYFFSLAPVDPSR